MADAKRVTILNQREGKVILPADPEELKKNPKAPHRTILAGHAVEVSAEEAPRLLRYKGLVDASKLVATADSAEVKSLKAQLAASEAENARLKKGAKDASPEDVAAKAAAADRKAVMKKGAKVQWDNGQGGVATGVVVKVHPHKKGAQDDTVDVKLDENGNVSPFPVSSLKPAPAEAAA